MPLYSNAVITNTAYTIKILSKFILTMESKSLNSSRKIAFDLGAL